MNKASNIMNPMAKLPNNELIKILTTERENYCEDVLIAVENILKQRGIRVGQDARQMTEVETKNDMPQSLDFSKDEVFISNVEDSEITLNNTQGMDIAELKKEVERGGKFVLFKSCMSYGVLTSKEDNIYFIRACESTLKHSFGYSFWTILFGWWALVPFGPYCAIVALFTNFKGGKNVTDDIIHILNNENNEKYKISFK
ncbi:MAG: hypothetical protein LBU91_05095 [Bacteroidales bacterium]|jgi:hypothetical protein|nr:hypothetical protein [Bacteroidales bacterium]